LPCQRSLVCPYPQTSEEPRDEMKKIERGVQIASALALLLQEQIGRLVASPPPVEATVKSERYTLLFLLSWMTTDLIPPPL
jgi:hypothetical protein